MIALPVAPADALEQIIFPALELLPDAMNTPQARVMLLAIGLQESGFATRSQFDNGPALGFWQNEQGGMVRGVLKSRATRNYALQLCAVRSVAPIESVVWDALEDDDILACGIARLGLWADPKPLPALTDVEGGWLCYSRNWRPGRPRPNEWLHNYATAYKAVAA